MYIINLVEDTKGNNECSFEHGLSIYVETKKHKLLVDCGATDLFLHNAKLLGIDVSQVDTVILSHGHYDHSGGIMDFAKVNQGAPIYMRETAGEGYYHITDTLEKYIGIDKKILELPQVVKVKETLEIDEELFLFSGIIGKKYPIKGNLQLKKKTDNGYVQDTFDHEQCLVITQEGKHILLSGCAHNGMINILDKYMEIFHAYPDVVISGFHMMQKEEYSEEDVKNIQDIAKELLKTGAIFYTGHCTGQKAYDMMKSVMGERLHPIHSGEILVN